MAQTQGRYPLIDSKQAAGALWGIWVIRDSIGFLKDFDSRTDVDTVPPMSGLTCGQHRLILGRAAKTLYATLLNGTKEEIERAVKFGLIALDAQKHLLDVRQAALKYGFKELEQKYVKGIKVE